MYKTKFIKSETTDAIPSGAYKKNGKIIVNGENLANKIQDFLNNLTDSVEIINIIPINSTFGSYTEIFEGGGGFGLTFTEGIIIIYKEDE